MFKHVELGRFSAPVADKIDRAYRDEGKSLFSRLMTGTKIRLMYIFGFTPLMGLDLVVSLFLGVRYSLGVFFSTDEHQEKRLKQQQKYGTIFSKNLYALLLSAAGIWSPKLIAFYFTSEKDKRPGVMAGGSYHHDPKAELKKPSSIEDVQQLIKEASQQGIKVMPVGAGRSQGKQFLPDVGARSYVLDLEQLNTVEINASEKTATVGAGTRWVDIQLQADKHKLALKVMQASNVFSVGGSIGTNIHGWDHKTGMLSNTILEITIVNAQGELQTLTPKDDLFHYITGGLGLFGVVVKVKLQLTDNLLLKEQGRAVSIHDYVNYFYGQVLNDETQRMHLFRLSLDPEHLLSSGVAVSYVADPDNLRGVTTPGLSAEPDRGTRFNQIMVNLARRFDWVRRWYWQGEEKRLLANNTKAQTTNEIMQPIIKAMFNPSVSESEWLQEYFLPPEKLHQFLDHLGHILMKNEVTLLNASVRFVKQNNQAPMSYAHAGDRFAVVLCFNQSLNAHELIKAQKWLREAQHSAVDMGGTFYLPYQHVVSNDDFNRAYPLAGNAMAKKQEVDPTALFTSGLYQKHLKQMPETRNHFREIMKNESSKKAFKGFLTTVFKRLEADKLFALLEEILKYKDTHAEIYEELCHRLPEVMSGVIGDFSAILTSLSAIKEDLAAQAKVLLPADVKHIDGLVEIGYPGRFVTGFTEQFKVRGEVVAVYEAPSVTDYIQTGFPRPYHKFAPLDYLKPTLSTLKDNSADVVTCYVGLHHFPEDQLPHILSEIRRVLRPGGRFILVDHDVTNAFAMSSAVMAHTIFNAVNGTSIEEEMREIRNFRPISYWREMLSYYNLADATEGPDVAMIRDNDPSRNRMVIFENSKSLELQQAPINQDSAQPLGQWRANKPAQNLAGVSCRAFTAPAQGEAKRSFSKLYKK